MGVGSTDGGSYELLGAIGSGGPKVARVRKWRTPRGGCRLPARWRDGPPRARRARHHHPANGALVRWSSDVYRVYTRVCLGQLLRASRGMHAAGGESLEERFPGYVQSASLPRACA